MFIFYGIWCNRQKAEDSSLLSVALLHSSIIFPVHDPSLQEENGAGRKRGRTAGSPPSCHWSSDGSSPKNASPESHGVCLQAQWTLPPCCPQPGNIGPPLEYVQIQQPPRSNMQSSGLADLGWGAGHSSSRDPSQKDPEVCSRNCRQRSCGHHLSIKMPVLTLTLVMSSDTSDL